MSEQIIYIALTGTAYSTILLIGTHLLYQNIFLGTFLLLAAYNPSLVIAFKEWKAGLLCTKEGKIIYSVLPTTPFLLLTLGAGALVPLLYITRAEPLVFCLVLGLFLASLYAISIYHDTLERRAKFSYAGDVLSEVADRLRKRRLRVRIDEVQELDFTTPLVTSVEFHSVLGDVSEERMMEIALAA